MLVVARVLPNTKAQVSAQVSRYSTSVFRCTELANGERVLDADPSLICGSSKHTVYMVLGCASTCIYMVGFPAVVGALVFYMHRKGLHTQQDWIDTLGWVYCSFGAP